MTDRELEKAQMFAFNYGVGKETTAYTMSAGLRLLARSQLDVWKRDRGISFIGTTEEVRTIAFALIAETLELSDELGWKSWKPPKIADKDRILGEYADLLAFLGTYTAYIISVIGVYPEELVQAYLEKVEENYRRFDERDAGSV
jgi:NTP pyrophosphatase (non-canonical NTP hydrolase)